MMKSLLSYLRLNRAIWENSVPFVAAVNELENLIASIESTWRSTDVDQSGLVAEKRNLKANLVNSVFAISSQMYAMASKTKDLVLQGKVKFSKSELESILLHVIFRIPSRTKDYPGKNPKHLIIRQLFVMNLCHSIHFLTAIPFISGLTKMGIRFRKVTQHL